MLRDTILSVADRKTEAVHVPEWDCTVWLREMSLAERLRLFDLVSGDGGGRHLFVWAILFALADESGKLVFTEADYDAVASKNADVLLRLGRQCAVFNRLVGDVVGDAKKN